MLIVRIKTVDHYGYNGRDHHPTEAMVGELVLIVTVQTFDEVNGEGALTAHQVAIGDTLGEPAYQLFTGVLAGTDQVVELIGHEIEVVSL